jgi:hypothetical protein
MNFLTKKEAQEQIANITTNQKPDEFIVALLGKYTRAIYSQYPNAVEKTFSTENKCDPKNIDEYNNFLSKCFIKSLKEEKTLILIIAGHGCNSKDNYRIMFDEHGTKFSIKTDEITEAINNLRKQHPQFKCVGLIQACYSNYFDISCFDASITLGNGTSRWDLLVKSLLDSIKAEKFTLGDIYKKLSYHLEVINAFNTGDENEKDLKNTIINNNYTFIQNLSK